MLLEDPPAVCVQLWWVDLAEELVMVSLFYKGMSGASGW